MTQADADAALKSKGLVAKVMEAQISFDDKYYPIGYVVKQSPKGSSSKVPEGTAVEIYICKGYKYDVEVDIPKDFQTSTYYLSIWENGKMLTEGNKINSEELSTYTFEGLITKEKNQEITVKISSDKEEYFDLYDVTVDVEKGRVKIIKEYTSYPTESENSSNTDGSSSNGSSSDEAV